MLATAVALLTVYSFLVLGNFSPIHMRTASALVGMTCVGLAVTSGYGMAAFADQKISSMHGLLPFMLLGLGVDDMFVIVNTIDQTPIHLKANE